LKIHPNDVLLEEMLLSLEGRQRNLLEHLVGCETCRDRVGSLMRSRSRFSAAVARALGLPTSPDEYDEALRRTSPEIENRVRTLASERVHAPALFVELASYPFEQQVLILRNDRRFRTWGLYELLVERSLESAVRDAAWAEQLGLLALRLADELDDAHYGLELIEDLRARAWAYIGNARRLHSDLRGSAEAFEQSESHLRLGTEDPVERAIVLDLRASLHRARRHFDEAARLLRQAVSLFLRNGHRHRAGRSLVNLSTVLHYAGRPEDAIPVLHRAIELIDPEQEPRLLLCARHNLIDYLASAGRFLEAQALYRESRPLYRDFPDAWAQNRRKWVRGKISRGLGQARLAESLFLAARDGFLAEGIPYDTALVSLELATLYAEQERTEDLKRLAVEMVPIFSSLQIHREALAALSYLQWAIETEQASLERVARIAAYLQRARHEPELRFEKPS
jgi:tetratricopeptide (TPR) repeat protein